MYEDCVLTHINIVWSTNIRSHMFYDPTEKDYPDDWKYPCTNIITLTWGAYAGPVADGAD